MDHTPNSCPHCGGDLTGLGKGDGAPARVYRPAGFVDAAAYSHNPLYNPDAAAVPTVDNHPDRRARDCDNGPSFDIGIW